MASKPQHWQSDASGYGYGQKGNSLPYNPSDPVLGTDMTQGEWDQLRELMRKAEAGGKMNELLTVHKKEVKNAPMNRHYPPDDDDWKDCEESHVPPSPSKVHAPTGTNSSAGSADNKAPPGALWPDAYNQNAWKVPPITPPPTLQQAGGNSGFVDAREYHKKWQDRPYDPNDDPWIEDVDKDPNNDKPVIQLFGNVVQKNADIAEAKKAAAAIAEIANRYCAPEEAILQDFQNSMHRFLYLLQQRQTHRYCLHLQLEVRKHFRSRKAKGRTMRKGASQNLPKVGSQSLQKVASQNSRKVVSQNLRKVAKMRRVARMTKVARMRRRENSKVNPKEKRETKGSRVQKGRHCPLPKLLVRSVHASPKSLRRLWKPIRTKCMTMVL